MRTQFFSAVINEATTLHNTTAGNAVWLVMDGRAAEQCQFMHGLVHTGLPLANTCSDHITAQDAVYQQRYNIAHKHACILHAVLARVKNRFKHARYNWYSYRYALYPPGSHTHTHTHTCTQITHGADTRCHAHACVLSSQYFTYHRCCIAGIGRGRSSHRICRVLERWPCRT